jgi:hypothetical protein
MAMILKVTPNAFRGVPNAFHDVFSKVMGKGRMNKPQG